MEFDDELSDEMKKCVAKWMVLLELDSFIYIHGIEILKAYWT